MISIFRFSSLINNLYIRTMKIRHFNAFQDNYMYLITDDKTRECAVVDPAEPDKVRTRIISIKSQLILSIQIFS